ncbi:c-type cytochrome [Propionicimonas sp.]|uniref:cytochrome bc1 complex diheme cytochrome c subunit n=1 Tax=Propionicimonas sp. TaxID=1955623 RepID=UPI0039E5CE1F
MRSPAPGERPERSSSTRRSLRRHKAARPVLLLLSLVLVGAVYAALAPATNSAAEGATDAQLIAKGKDLFAVNCASCHGLNGEGLAQQGAPALTNVGSAAVDFQVRTGRMPAADTGVQAPPKENTFTDDEIAAMAAYVASLGTGPATPEEDQYSPSGLTAEDVARGGELFRTNCSACHNFKGAGGALPNGVVAPSLQDADAKTIWEAMRTGPGQMPVFASGAIPDEDVQKVVAYVEQVNQTPSSGLTLGGLGPVSEGFWAWVAGIGSLVLFAVWIATRGARA